MRGASVYFVRDKLVTRMVAYWDRDLALADLGLAPKAHADETPN